MTQLRRTVPADLVTLFASGLKLITADLVTITLAGGVVLRWTSFDRVVTIGSTSWLLGPGIQTSRLKWTAGTEVDTMTLTLFGDSSTLINGAPMMPFINGGGLDGALVQVWRAYAADFTAQGLEPDWKGMLHRHTGRVSDIDRPSRVEAVISVRSIFELLNVQLPRNVYQSQCNANLYDATCGVDKAAKTVTGTVTTGSDALRLSFSASGLTQGAGYFDLGAVRFLTGANAGVLRTVRRHAAGGAVTVVQPLPVAVSVGDTFQIYPGCDRSEGTCAFKFLNYTRFRGARFIPVADSII